MRQIVNNGIASREKALLKAVYGIDMVGVEKSESITYFTEEAIEKFKVDVIKKAEENSEYAEEILEKAKKDLSKLQKKVITDKRGHKRTVYVKIGEKSPEKPQKKGLLGQVIEVEDGYKIKVTNNLINSISSAFPIKHLSDEDKKDVINIIIANIENEDKKEKVLNGEVVDLKKEDFNDMYYDMMEDLEEEYD